MEMYKQAAKLGLRFSTSKGSLTVEQLFHLSQTELATAIKNQKKVLKKNDEDELGFLDESSKVDVIEQLRFDLLKDVYLTKKTEAEAIRNEREKKEHNQKILELIQSKKQADLQNKSIEELEAMLK